MIVWIAAMAMAQDVAPADGCEDSYANANGACVSTDADIGTGTTIGEDAQVGSGASIGPNVEFGPASVVTRGPILAPRASMAGESDPLRINAVGEGAIIGRRSSIGVDAEIGDDVVLSRAVQTGARFVALDGATVGYAAQIGDDVTVGAAATLGSLVTIGDWTTVEGGAVLARDVLVADATQASPNSIGGIIGPGTQIGTGVTIGTSVRVRKDAMIGDGATLQGTARIGRGAKVEAGATVSSGSRVAANASVCSGAVLDGSLRRGETFPPGGCGGAPVETVTLNPGGTPVDLTMVLVPAGTFTMGCVAGRDDRDGGPCGGFDNGNSPVEVTLTGDYYCSETEVTQAQFGALLSLPAIPSGFQTAPNQPVSNLSWQHAAWWANTLSEQEGLTKCYPCTGSYNASNPSSMGCTAAPDPYACTGYRLPTYAEWEYAARGGEDFIYSGSDTVGDVAHYIGNNSPTGLKDVGTLAPNGFGLYDMSGNVVELISEHSQLATYPAGPLTDWLTPTGSNIYIRGGWSSSSADVVRPTQNAHLSSSTSPGSAVGMRVCRSAP